MNGAKLSSKPDPSSRSSRPAFSARRAAALNPRCSQRATRLSPLLFLALSILATSANSSAAAENAARGVELPPTTASVSLVRVSYWSFFRNTARKELLELDLAFRPDEGLTRSPIRLGIGVRTGLPEELGIPLEGYLRAGCLAGIGPWTPGIGLELGLSGISVLSEAGRRGAVDATYALEAERLQAPYASVLASPLAFRFRRWTLSTLELHVGISGNPVGSVSRMQLGLLRVGGTL